MSGELAHVVVGAGMRGLVEALRLRRAAGKPDDVALVESLPQPGGCVRTQRSNGFSCELGPFAFSRDEIDPLLGLLPQAPPVIEALPSAKQGWAWTGTERHALTVQPVPCSFRAGCEEIVQAARRELGTCLRLGRTVTSLRPLEAGWQLDLDGQVPTPIVCSAVHLCTPIGVAARLLAGLDPALAGAVERLRSEPRAFAFLGGYQNDLPELVGYGIAPTDDAISPVQEIIFCSQVFAHRTLPGQCLVRLELAGDVLDASDEEVLRVAEQELRKWTGCRGRLGFTKLHRFAHEVVDGAHVECRMRLHGLQARAPGLRV